MKKVCISIGDIYSRVLRAPADAWVIIRQECKARPEGYMYMPKFRSGLWDGYISLLKRNLIPTGLLRHVEDALKVEGYFCVYDKVVHPWLATDLTPIGGILHGIALRDYQIDAVIDLLEAQRGIARMATNAGKTAVYATVIKLLGNSDALVVVRSKDLLYQTQKYLIDYSQRGIGLIGDSHRDETDICVATIQTLNSLRKHNPLYFEESFVNNKILVVDECHMIGNNRTFDVLMNIPGWHRFGVSGTPLNRGKLNDLKLIACTGPVCVNVTNAQLINNHWSAKPLVHVHDACSSGDYWDKDYQPAYDACIVNNPGRNDQVIDLALSDAYDGRSVLIIVTRIAHGEELHRLLIRLSFWPSDAPYVFVNGNSELAERQAALRMLDKEPCIVIATNIFDEGVDVPALDTIILACGGKSHIRLLQRIGRGLRKKAGENIVHIHDFLDSDNKYLLNHSEERLDVYEKEGFEVQYESSVA